VASRGFSDTMDVWSATLAALGIILLALAVMVVGAVILTAGMVTMGFFWDVYAKYGGVRSERRKG